jgi:4-hydroxy-tetrahydrodipicolinate reductase
MTQQPAIAILGASGRMGQMLAQTILASDKAKLVAAADRVGSDWLGSRLRCDVRRHCQWYHCVR